MVRHPCQPLVSAYDAAMTIASIKSTNPDIRASGSLLNGAAAASTILWRKASSHNPGDNLGRNVTIANKTENMNSPPERHISSHSEPAEPRLMP